MDNKSAVKTHSEPLFHVVKRADMPALQAWLIRVATIVIAFIIVGLFLWV